MAKVITNGHTRDLLDFRQLTAMEQDEHDWAKGRDCEEFFRFKGDCYAVSDFTSPGVFPLLKDWDGYKPDTFFSGILIRYPRDEFGGIESGIIVGWYY